MPCLTLAGSCHAHNVGLSLLTAVGLQQDWVAHSGGPGNMPLLHTQLLQQAPAWECMSQLSPNCLLIAPFPRFLPAVEEYIAKAVALTSDVRRLARLRAGLRQRMLQVGAGWDGAEQCCVWLANCLQLRGLSGGMGSKSSAPQCADAAPCLRLPVQSPLCDAPTFVRQLEGTYAQLWQRWLDQQQQRRQE